MIGDAGSPSQLRERQPNGCDPFVNGLHEADCRSSKNLPAAVMYIQRIAGRMGLIMARKPLVTRLLGVTVFVSDLEEALRAYGPGGMGLDFEPLREGQRRVEATIPTRSPSGLKFVLDAGPSPQAGPEAQTALLTFEIDDLQEALTKGIEIHGDSGQMVVAGQMVRFVLKPKTEPSPVPRR